MPTTFAACQTKIITIPAGAVPSIRMIPESGPHAFEVEEIDRDLLLDCLGLRRAESGDVDTTSFSMMLDRWIAGMKSVGVREFTRTGGVVHGAVGVEFDHGVTADELLEYADGFDQLIMIAAQVPGGVIAWGRDGDFDGIA